MFCTRTRLETEAHVNSEMAYLRQLNSHASIERFHMTPRQPHLVFQTNLFSHVNTLLFQESSMTANDVR